LKKHFKIFFTSIRNNFFALTIFLAVWTVSSFFFEKYILPAPWSVMAKINSYLNSDFMLHLAVTLYRTLAGFIIAFIGGGVLGIIAFFFRLKDVTETFMLMLQILPGTIVGIIFMLMFGIGDAAPIALIVAMALPLMTINTTNTLLKKNSVMENVILGFGGTTRDLIRDLYIPALIPALRSNFTLGIGQAFKVVVLGEFIASENGLGYLLNLSKIYFDMNAVFFYLSALLVLALIIQVIGQFLFVIFFEKYLLPDQP